VFDDHVSNSPHCQHINSYQRIQIDAYINKSASAVLTSSSTQNHVVFLAANYIIVMMHALPRHAPSHDLLWQLAL